MKKLTDQELALKRFEQPAAGIRIVFRPQCAECAKSIKYYQCKAFDEKPDDYMTNQKPCPEFMQE